MTRCFHRHGRNRQGGYSFIELLIVCTIAAILVSIAMPLWKLKIRRGKEQELRSALYTMRKAIDDYHYACQHDPLFQLPEDELDSKGTPAGCWPPDLQTLVDGVDLGGSEPGAKGKKLRFLRAIPRDPFNEFEDEYDEGGWKLRSYQDDLDTASWGRENIYDVRSASEMKAMDGTLYNEW